MSGREREREIDIWHMEKLQEQLSCSTSVGERECERGLRVHCGHLWRRGRVIMNSDSGEDKEKFLMLSSRVHGQTKAFRKATLIYGEWMWVATDRVGGVQIQGWLQVAQLSGSSEHL